MAINLMKSYETKLDERFKGKSLTEAWCGHDYDWDGVNSIVVYTNENMAVQDYTLTGANRFTSGNAPTNIGDEANTYTLQKKRSFSGVIEGVQNMDQKMIKKANSLLKQTWDEVMVPEIDAYRLSTWVNGAGTVDIGSALTKGTVVEQMMVGGSKMNNRLVNRDGRVVFVTESLAVKCKLASELANNESFTTKAIVNGQIARLNGVPIVAVPDSWMPAGVEFFIKYKRASADPTKLKMLRALNQVQGIYGTVLEGLTRYDSFVLAQKAFGIYVYATTSHAAVTPSIAVSGGTVTLTASGATVIYYTTDGSNPKTSGTVATYDGSNKPTGLTEGQVVKAYATLSGYPSSGIAEHVVLASED